jgi:hypothetical protein
VRQYVALSDGPSVGPVADPEVPMFGVLWVVGLALLIVVGIREAVRRGFASSLLVPVVAGAALAAEYVVLTDAQAPRFLLPAFALLTVPTGLGLSSLVGGFRARTGAALTWAVLASALVVVWLLQQVVVARRIEDGVTAQRASAAQVGSQVRAHVGRQPCFVDSESNFPIVGYAAGCRAAELGDRLGTWARRADRLESEGARPFLVLRRSAEPRPPDGTVLVRTVPSGDVTWYVYEPA